MSGPPEPQRLPPRSRGQAHTLEAVVGALLLLTSIGFALQMTIVTPLSASTSSQHIENQLRSVSAGVLSSGSETGSLQRAVLYWNDTRGAYHDTTELGYYTSAPPDNEFGDLLNRTFDQEGIAYNVNVEYQTRAGRTTERRMIYRGNPSEHAVVTTRTVVIRGNDSLIASDGTPQDLTVSNSTRFFVPDARQGGTGSVYNVVRVEVIVWRI